VLGDFKTNTPSRCIEQQEAENPDMAQLVLVFGELHFVLEAYTVCAEVIRVLVSHLLYLRRVGLRKGSFSHDRASAHDKNVEYNEPRGASNINSFHFQWKRKGVGVC